MIEIPVCVICFQEMLNGLTSAPCGHVFHKECIGECVVKKMNCPLCRSKLVSSKLLDLSFELQNKVKDIEENESKNPAIDACIAFYETKIKDLFEEINELSKLNKNHQSKIKTLQTKNQALSKFKNMYKITLKTHEKLLNSFPHLTNLSNLLAELKNSQSIVPWISETIENFKESDQIINYHNALLLISNSLQISQRRYFKLEFDLFEAEQKIKSMTEDSNLFERIPLKVIFT